MEELEEIKIAEDTIIFCDELAKIYMSDGLKVMALQGLDLKVHKGEMMAIIGKSGSGKSTLLNMIGALETLSAGRLFVDGKDLSLLKEKELIRYRRTKVGFIWQKSSRNLFPYLTVLGNVELPMYFQGGKKKENRKRAMELLEAVGMTDHANKLPSQLSGGEQQRVAIAVALANRPRILLADEPTGAVDSKTADMIFELFHKLNREMGITILIVTHDLNIANKVDRTVMISDGKISTEKIRQRTGKAQRADLSQAVFTSEMEQEEYSVLDKARRLQLSEDMLEEAGISGNKVRVEVVGGKVVISKMEEKK